ncbi:hypothetical protein J437_LFUL011467 [Ladona fulva]|uniref:G-protein coupled receptors family 2 profile 2 domain-containing protein n=1 Tax=Ladona fulva TaxID=123851 RepID=A0A8K0PAC0_LADFU|nr:hypothetical protein J437_LFUL011467 [Ladona fulva]
MTRIAVKLFVFATILLTISGISCATLCEPWERSEVLNPVIKIDNSVWDPENELLYPNGTYWTDESDNVTIYGCPCMLSKPCIRKCCQKDEAMDYDSLACLPHEDPWPWFQPNVPADPEYNIRVENFNHFGLIVGNYCRGYVLEPPIYPDEDKFYINFTDGTLAMPLKNRSGMGVDRYCLEYVPKNHSYLPYVCFRQLGLKAPPLDPCVKWRYILYPIGMSISVFFLLISLLVLALLPDMQNLHGKCLMCHIASFICAYIFLSVVQSKGHELSINVCVTYGFIIYFSLLCTFFWLNIMCVDICVAFSSLQLIQGNGKERELKKFLIYFSYAFGLPLVITGITVFIELYPYIPATMLKPNFKKTCWFHSAESRRAYFVFPVGIIVLCNAILFLLTAFSIWKAKKETLAIHANNSKRHNNKEDKNRFKLYIKLSVVMGLSWVMEIISWLAGGSLCYWIVTDLINTLQGAFIFIIFTCKKKVRRKLIGRYGARWPFLKVLNLGQSSEVLSSSAYSSNTNSSDIKMKNYPSTSSSSVPDTR